MSKNKKTNKRTVAMAELARGTLEKLDIRSLIEDARYINRKFIIHVGPTNSGKTYDSLERLKTANNGVYLGPLRLLALEVFEKLNASGCVSSLKTGEEAIIKEGSRVVASTIEMFNKSIQYDIAVIDEAQMMADSDRGGHWTRAIIEMNAKEIHVCTAPEAVDVIKSLVEDMYAEYEIVEHHRLAPLVFDNEKTSLDTIKPGDACIVFSRKNVLSVAAQLELKGLKASVIYGALPPQARRMEVEKFESGITQVVVATDAIGMGVSLPIKRVVFLETEKFDGIERRPLNVFEIKQVAGRAGRYGIYDIGYVSSSMNRSAIKYALDAEVSPIKKVYIPFPEEALDTKLPLYTLFNEWESMPRIKGFKRQSVEESKFLLGELGILKRKQGEQIFAPQYDFVTCPVDIKDEELVMYWKQCCVAIINDEEMPPVDFPEETLDDCERAYKAYDIRHQMLRRIGIEESTEEARNRLCDKITSLLGGSKVNFVKTCRICHKVLPTFSKYNICDYCYYTRF
ncbi:MAG: hypothetical protein MJ236_03250 [Clostridia bacterium]|nr:hypothetical protein [Clostridia bacterium]